MAVTQTLFSVIAVSVFYISCGLEVEIHAKLGTIIGKLNKVTVKDTKYKVKTFLGIPYAKPPIGVRRFQKPEELGQYNEPFQAFKIGNACPQNGFPGMHTYTTSEDCLYLNIYVPDRTPDKPSGHAVMVFIHGGGFALGAGETFVGDQLSSFGNVIYVSINYRLGVFGFMDSGDGRIPGNLGFHDQHVALKWISENIEAFGGDKTRVTIFGESAGGTGVIFQGLYPENRGLFQRIICQSGVPSARGLFVKDQKDVFDIFTREMGCEKENVDAKIECLKDVDSDTIMNKLKELASTQPLVRFLPTVDGEIVQIPPEELTSLSNQREVSQVEFFRSLDVAIGFNNYEGAMFVLSPLYQFEDNETFLVSREEFKNKLIPHIMKVIYNNTKHAINTIVISHYTNWTDPDLPENNRLQYAKLMGDLYFTVGSTEFLKLHANSSKEPKTYAYYFTAVPSNRILKTPEWIEGANHADELNYVFMFDPELNKMIEDKKPWAEWEYELSYRMATYWSNFAKTGNPNEPEEVLPVWPQYDVKNNKYIRLGKDMSDSSVGNHLYERQVNLWLGLIPEVEKELSHDHEEASPFVKKPDESCSSKDGECNEN